MLKQASTRYLGLAPFLRASIAGEDMAAHVSALLAQAEEASHAPVFWLNLATALFCAGQRETALDAQTQALNAQRLYRQPTQRHAAWRLLLIAVPGDLAANVPLDCLLDGGEVELLWYYATPDAPLPEDLPEHDALMVVISDTVESRPVLDALVPLLDDWDRPVINPPQCIRNVERERASYLLQGIPGLRMPPTRLVTRAQLQRVASRAVGLTQVVPECRFPLLVRPQGSHGGHALARIEGPGALDAYLAAVCDDLLYVSPFIDYADAAGTFRKYRVLLIDGRAYGCHMGISSDWMIHYVNAGMYENAGKRAEEAAFLNGFASFAGRHAAALAALHQRIKLDYLGIDCAETPDGELLVFEVDHAMVVHAMDPVATFPYKQAPMTRVRLGLESYLARLAMAAQGAGVTE